MDIGDKSLQCSRKVDCLKLWLMWKAVGSDGLEQRVNKAFVNARYAVSAQHDSMQIISFYESYKSGKQISGEGLSFLQVFFGGNEEKERLFSSAWGNLLLKKSSIFISLRFQLSIFSVTSRSFWISASGSYHPVFGGKKEIQITKKNWPKWVFRLKHEVYVILPDFNPLGATWYRTECFPFISSQVAPAIKERMVKKGSMMIGYQPLEDKVNFFRLIVLSPQVCKKDMDFCLDEIERLGNDL